MAKADDHRRWAYACEMAGLEVVAACEADPWRRSVYVAAHHNSAVKETR